MRWLGIIAAIALSACQPAARFHAGEVWTLKPEFPDKAKVIIDRIEPREAKTVVHLRIVNLPAHPRMAEALGRQYLFSPHPPRPEDMKPRSFLMSGISNPDDPLEYFTGSVELNSGPDNPDGPVSIPHIALYEQDLLQSVSAKTSETRELSPTFTMYYDLWKTGEASYPDLNDADLDRPLSKTIDYSLKQVDNTIEGWLIDIPPAAPEAGETPLEDKELADRCRQWTKVVIDQLGHEFHATQLALSPKFGAVWRGDHAPKGWKAGDPTDRAFCWNPKGSREGKMAFGWALPPLP